MLQDDCETPTKIGKRNCRLKEKDSSCLCCGIYLLGVTSTFNAWTCEGLLDKISLLIERPINLKENSSRVCKPCFRRVDGLTKKSSILSFEVQKFRNKFLSLAEQESAETRTPENYCKRSAKTSPFSRKRSRVQLFEKGSCGDLDGITPLQNDFTTVAPAAPEQALAPAAAVFVQQQQPQENLYSDHKDQCKELSVEININYPSGTQTRVLKDELGHIIKYLALGLYKTACRSAVKHPQLGKHLQDFVFTAMDSEFQYMCKARSCSVLRDTGSKLLTEFQLQKFNKELQANAPVTTHALTTLCQSKRSKRKDDSKSSITVPTLAAIILYSRCPEMSALAYRLGFIMRHAGTGTLGLETLQRHGLTVAPKSLRMKAHELGQNCDEKVNCWKEKCITVKETQECVKQLGNHLRNLSYLPQLPLVGDLKSYAEKSKKTITAQSTTEVFDEFQTLNISGLNLCCSEPEPLAVIGSACSMLRSKGVGEDVISDCLDSIVESADVDANLVDAVADYDMNAQVLSYPSYQIVGDNVDLEIKVRHLNSENKNKSFHWFNLVAFQDQVSGSTLPDTHERTLADVPITTFIPSHDDVQRLKQDYIVLWSRVIVKHLRQFSFLRNAVVYHIPHEYSDIMMEPVMEVPLGVLPKNENCNEDMVDIMETIQQKYVPLQHKILDSGEATIVPAEVIFFGGDQLTEERARNIQKARADGRTELERLEATWPKNEDWHAIRTAYKAVIKILRNDDSLSDWGTYTSNAVVTGNFNAMKGVETEYYEQIREFFRTETDAFLVSAALHHFGMKTMEDSPTSNGFPPELLHEDVQAKRKWLYQQTAQMFDLYAADSISDISNAKDSLASLERVRLPCRHLHCPREFKYPKCRLNHEKTKHGLIIEVPDQSQAPKKSPEDHIFNYGCLHITLGLMLRDAEDSVKEGDGARLLRIWKFLTYLFRLKGCHKYALAGLRLIASVEALLTPRQAHRLTWNRFAGVKKGPAKRISRDLRVEQLNKIAKAEIRALGFPNINDESVVSATKVTAPLERLIQQSKADLGMEVRSGHHCNHNANKVFCTILNQVHSKAKVFSNVLGREYEAFPKLKRDLYRELSLKSLHKWLTKHRNHWHRQNRHFYKLV